MKNMLVLALILIPTSVLAVDGVLLNVNQTNTIAWNWEQTEGPVRAFVFKCGSYVKELEADARSLRFGSLIDEPGQYSGCTLAAKNEAGLSAPVALPSFNYAYSYWSLGQLVLELAATLSAGVGVLAVSARQALGYLKRRKQAPIALPEPVIVMEKASARAYHPR